MRVITIKINDDDLRFNREVEIDGRFQYSEHIPSSEVEYVRGTEIGKFIEWVQSKVDEGKAE